MTSMANGDQNRKSFGAGGIIAAIVLFCIVIAAVVWFGGWGFSNSAVTSPNPAPPAAGTNPPAQMPTPANGAAK
jgi:uncharacterized iron-regulated membrane protein